MGDLQEQAIRQHCKKLRMPTAPPLGSRLSALFTDVELEFLKRRFDVQFGQAPAVVDEISSKTWKSGPEKGRPKIPTAIAALLNRNLMMISTEGRMPIAKFTDAGLIPRLTARDLAPIAAVRCS